MPGKPCVIGAVGEKDAVLALRAVGIRVLAAETPEQAAAAVFRLAQDGVPVIFITEKAARGIPETLEKYQDDPRVAIIPVPGGGGTDGFGMQRVRASVLKAVGADILLGDNAKEQ